MHGCPERFPGSMVMRSRVMMLYADLTAKVAV
jgi:hypothetical protein